MSEDRLAELLRALPPPPEAWVRAAQELPMTELGLEPLGADEPVDTAADHDAGWAAYDADPWEAGADADGDGLGPDDPLTGP